MPLDDELVEPPPELPLHSFLGDPPKSRKKIVNKLKELLVPSKEFLPREEFEDIPLRPPAFPLVEDSTKTFLTGNVEPAEAQRQQLQQPYQRQHLKSGIEIPHSVILGDPSAFSNFSSSLHFKRIGLKACVKGLDLIAQKKLETSKYIQKFLRDIISWGQNSSFDNLDSLELVNEIQLIFQQDLIIQQNLAQRLKLLASELDGVCTREQDLAREKRNLGNALKKYRLTFEKKGENNDETILLREKVIAQERSFESYRSHYQFAVSVTARHAFKEVGIEFYERACDLKQTSCDFLKLTLQSLENVDTNGFIRDLEKIRLERAEKNWSKLSKEQKTDPKSWNDFFNGGKDNNDTLMKEVFKSLPKEYSRLEPEIDKREELRSELRSDVPTTGLDESISAIQSAKFNPITSNEYFSPRTEQHEIGIEIGSKKKDNIEDQRTRVRSVDPNVTRNMTGGTSTQCHLESKGHKPILQNDNLNGFILNFSNISQQFDDAEKHLQENRWLE